MHSTLVRAQNAFGFFTTVVSCVAALIALTVLISPQAPSATLKMRDVQVVKGRAHYYSNKKEEYAHIKFDLDADLSTLFNWNTKQVFLWVQATYPSNSPSTPPSQAIIWDAILPSTSAPWHQNQYIHPVPGRSRSSTTAHNASDAAAPGQAIGTLRLKNQRPKYQITDPSGRMTERANATLELGYNVQPWVGALLWTNWNDWGYWKGLRGARSQEWAFPELKGGKKEADVKTERGGEKNRGSPA